MKFLLVMWDLKLQEDCGEFGQALRAADAPVEDYSVPLGLHIWVGNLTRIGSFPRCKVLLVIIKILQVQL